MLTDQNIKNELLYTSLVNLGPYYPLDITFKFFDQDILEAFPDKWKQYNPRKGNPRLGLSLTSLDGGMSGIPDLDSLAEYNALHKTEYEEASFRTPTEALRSLDEISGPLHEFIPHLGRSHLIRMGEGGHFPFHRDAQQFGANTFRLISPLLACGSSEFCFIFDQKKIHLEPKVLYFMNTKVEHALFSMNPKAMILVLNVILSEESVGLVLKHLLAR